MSKSLTIGPLQGFDHLRREKQRSRWCKEMGITHYTWDASYKKASLLQISSRKGHRTYARSEAHTEKSQTLYKMPLGVCSDDEHQRVCSLADGGQEAMKE